MIKFNVNGNSYQTDASEDMPLLWVLRDELGITNPKFGCGIAVCGACTVRVNGMAVRSCQARIGDLSDAEVATLEAENTPEIQALKEAWTEGQVAQCGYCQTGQIMQAASLLERTIEPTDEEIDNVMSGNLCRCGTYVRIREAIHAAAKKLA